VGAPNRKAAVKTAAFCLFFPRRTRTSKGVGKKDFSRGGIIQTEGFEGVKRLVQAKRSPGGGTRI